MPKLSAGDKRLLKQITSYPWDPAAYRPLEEQLKSAAEIGLRNIAEGHYRNLAMVWPNMSDAQLRSCSLDTALNKQWDLHGIARRFLQDDPAELARFTAVSVRIQWIDEGHGRGLCAAQWNTAVWALAVGDNLALDRLLATLPYALEAGHRDDSPPHYIPLYNAVFGVLRGETKTASSSVARLASRKLPGADASVVTCLEGMLSGSAEQVMDGLVALGPAIRKIRAIDPHHKLLAVLVHGMYELCRRVDPELTRLWDVGSGLPWDAEFHDWRQTAGDPLAGVDLSDLPERTRLLLTELPEPDWWSDIA